LVHRKILQALVASVSRVDEPEIGDVDEGIVERGEDTGNAEDQLAYSNILVSFPFFFSDFCFRISSRGRIPSRTEGPREMFSWGARVVVFLGAILRIGRLLVISSLGGENEAKK
jgi:hypothetical protein